MQIARQKAKATKGLPGDHPARHLGYGDRAGSWSRSAEQQRARQEGPKMHAYEYDEGTNLPAGPENHAHGHDEGKVKRQHFMKAEPASC